MGEKISDFTLIKRTRRGFLISRREKEPKDPMGVISWRAGAGPVRHRLSYKRTDGIRRQAYGLRIG